MGTASPQVAFAATADPGPTPAPAATRKVVGGLPGMEALASTMMKKEMNKLEIPEIPEFIQMLSDAGARLYACGLAMEMFKLKKEDLTEQVEDVLTAMDFFDKAEGAQIIFV